MLSFHIIAQSLQKIKILDRIISCKRKHDFRFANYFANGVDFKGGNAERRTKATRIRQPKFQKNSNLL